MPPVEFEPTISEGERPQTYALDRAAIGTGTYKRIQVSFPLITPLNVTFVISFRV